MHAAEGVPIHGWQIRRDGRPGWQPVPVPGCWEDAGFPADDPGPYWYRAEISIPPFSAGQRLWLRFGAVSYACTVFVNGQEMGGHTGMWDDFEIEITPAVAPNRPAEILVCVEKPASLTAGPDSPAVPGRFPMRQTLSGFLPYVWGHAFGGVWQEVRLAVTGPRRLESLRIRGAADGRLHLVGACSASGVVSVSIWDPAGSLAAKESLAAAPGFEWSGRLCDPLPWSPDFPALYVAEVRLPDGDVHRMRFGLRTLQAGGAALRLNRQPLYPRLALSWGWYPDRRCPNPGADRVRADLLRLRSMGYNGVKLCLWLPPPYYFDLADELGMLLWVELPMWLPDPTPFFYQQARSEYRRLVQAARSHPSVLLYTLGCELNRSVDAAFLAELYALVKAQAGDALVRDNSGSGEAYGGWLDESADFYDHHFYCDLQFLRPLLDAFSPVWRARKPWLMGEFCDYDTVRDLPTLLGTEPAASPWWLQHSPRENPQGARWEMRPAAHAEALRRSGLWERSGELMGAAHRQATLHRKATLEAVRANPSLAGYVVTGEADTPISSAGMWDDLGRPKFDPGEFRAFNDDLVLTLGWDRQRTWVAGGDRPAYRDAYSYRAGATVRAHIVAANHTAFHGAAHFSWQAGEPGRPPSAEGQARVRLAAGRVQEVALAQFVAPPSGEPCRVMLHACLQAGARTVANTWPVWVYPADAWAGVAPFGLLDPLGVLADLPALAPGLCSPYLPARGLLPPATCLVCTAWAPDVEAWVAEGGRAILLQQAGGPPGPLPVVECPFWRESLKWAEPHAAWGDFPCERDPGLQFYALATDCALVLTGREAGATPLLRRLDTRGLEVHEYAVALRWGRGRIIATTLRLQGGLGDQPTGISRSPAATHLLAGWVRYLQRSAGRPDG